MVASIGKMSSPSQGASYFEKDGYYAKDNPAHKDASAWSGKGAGRSGYQARSVWTPSGRSSKARCRAGASLSNGVQS